MRYRPWSGKTEPVRRGYGEETRLSDMHIHSGSSTDPTPSPVPEQPAVYNAPPLVKPRVQPSIADGFAGIILGSAGMVGFLAVIWTARYYTKDASLDTGAIVFVLVLIAIILAVAAYQYVRLKRRGS